MSTRRRHCKAGGRADALSCASFRLLLVCRRCPVGSCPGGKRRFKPSRGLPPEFVELPLAAQRHVVRLLRFHPATPKVCNNCYKRIQSESALLRDDERQFEAPNAPTTIREPRARPRWTAARVRELFVAVHGAEAVEPTNVDAYGALLAAVEWEAIAQRLNAASVDGIVPTFHVSARQCRRTYAKASGRRQLRDQLECCHFSCSCANCGRFALDARASNAQVVVSEDERDASSERRPTSCSVNEPPRPPNGCISPRRRPHRTNATKSRRNEQTPNVQQAVGRRCRSLLLAAAAAAARTRDNALQSRRVSSPHSTPSSANRPHRRRAAQPFRRPPI